MYSKVYSGTWEGIEGILVQVEADISNGLPVFEMVGYLSTEVKEAKKRVRTALKNQGYLLPPKRITVNLAPGHLRKSGSVYDLAIGISVLIAGGFIRNLKEPILFLGEMGLDGSVKGVQGVLPIVLKAREEGIRICIIPKSNQKEAEIAKDVCCIGVASLEEVITIFRKCEAADDYSELVEYYGDLKEIEDAADIEESQSKNWPVGMKKNDSDGVKKDDSNRVKWKNSDGVKRKKELDFADIKGQILAKRALEIAVSGHHNLIMSGSPGSGKSALAKRIPTIMPELTYEEQLEITRIYSVSGNMPESGELIKERPYRAPHHSITMSALIGGGKNAEAGEISLAHKSILFLDELPEFKRDVLDMLRQPLEDGKIVVSRNRRTCIYPADFMLVAAMNPCPCGYYPNRQKCFCSENQIRKYQEKISGPLLDRIDMLVSVQPVSFKTIKSDRQEENSEQIRKRVERTRAIQSERYKNESFHVNANLTETGIQKYCHLAQENEDWLESFVDQNDMTYRGYVRILKLARTIADMEEAENIEERHLTEAIMFRMGWNYES